jgi:hypothetical protein
MFYIVEVQLLITNTAQCESIDKENKTMANSSSRGGRALDNRSSSGGFKSRHCSGIRENGSEFVNMKETSWKEENIKEN